MKSTPRTTCVGASSPSWKLGSAISPAVAQTICSAATTTIAHWAKVQRARGAARLHRRIAKIGYDVKAKEAYVEFRESGGIYAYSGVPLEVFAELARADSKGRFVAR